MRNRRPTHPGEVLREEVIKPLNLTTTEAAKRLGISRKNLSALLNEKISLSPDMAVRVALASGTSPLSWMEMQVKLDIWRAEGKAFHVIRFQKQDDDSDINITDNEGLVYQLYSRKQDTYYVNKVYPVFSVSDLRHDLIDRARKMTRARTQNHPWQNMTDEEILRSAGLILTDTSTGREGITLAAILLFGPDNLIVSVLAHHKTDAIFRVFNMDRYDDRDVIITNLLESHDRLIAFGKKHVNDLFVMEGLQSISARDKILREIVSNSLAHRDYSNAYVAKFVIEKDRIFTENSNRSHGFGNLDHASFEPFPKNPPISKVFREIGLADELGSGMRNTYKYTKLYSGAVPTFSEGEVFRIVIPLNEAATATVGPSKVPKSHAETLDETLELRVIALVKQNPRLTQRELSEQLAIPLATIKRTMMDMVQKNILERKDGKRYGYWEITTR